VHGHAEPAIYYHHQHVSHQPTVPAVYVDRGHSPSVGGDASQSPVVQPTVLQTMVSQPTVSQTTVLQPMVNDVSDSVELTTPVTEAPAHTAASGLAAECSEQPLANMKEKTPMCLINELARFNKVRALHNSVQLLGLEVMQIIK